MAVRLVLLLALLPLAACSAFGADPNEGPDDLTDYAQDAEALVGTWDLFRTTTAGFRAPVETASVTAGTETYTFQADGMVERYRDGDLVEAEPYDVRDLPHVGVLLHIGTEAEYRRVFFGVKEDRFYIDYRPSDGSLYEYRRL